MIHVYIDPHSYIYSNNALFREDTKGDRDDLLSFWRYLRNYCRERGVDLNTVDLRSHGSSTADDVYVSFEHKNFVKRAYWRLKNKKYRAIKLDTFKKRILFQFEPPFIMPEVYANIDQILGMYDETFFTCKIQNPRIRYVHYWQTYNTILPEYWENSNRDFLTMINSNSAFWNLKKFLLTLVSTGKFPLSDYKELVSERIKAVVFFSKNNEIDLYGSGWNKRPPFPYWFSKSAIRKVYKGRVKSKYLALSKYNFSICYENCIVPGYITEKIFDCFFVGTIPIYLGAPDIADYVPKNCFVDKRDFKNYEELRIFLKSLSESEIQTYKENGRRFLESEQYKPFTKEHFAKIFLEACMG